MSSEYGVSVSWRAENGWLRVSGWDAAVLARGNLATIRRLSCPLAGGGCFGPTSIDAANRPCQHPVSNTNLGNTDDQRLERHHARIRW